MQPSLTRLSSQVFPACRFIVHPTSRFVSPFTSVLVRRKDFFVDVGRDGACSVLLSSHRNYIVRGDQPGERPPVNSGKGDEEQRKNSFRVALDRNRKIINYGKDGWWKAILKLADEEKDQFNNVNWSTAFFQLGKIRSLYRGDPLFESFVNEYARRLRDRGLGWAGIRQVSNVVYTIGKMRLRNSATHSILEFISQKENARKIVQGGSPQAITNIAWVFATMFVKAPHFFYEIETRADWLVTNGNAQDVANTAWAFSLKGLNAQSLFAGIEKRAEWLVWYGDTQDIANVAWACANLGMKSPNLFAEIELCPDRLVQNGNPQEVATTAWACAVLGVQSPRLFSEIDRRASWMFQKGTPKDIEKTAWAFETLGVPSTNFLWKKRPSEISRDAR